MIQTNKYYKNDLINKHEGKDTFTENQAICLLALQSDFCRLAVWRNGNIDWQDAPELWSNVIVDRSARRGLWWILPQWVVTCIDQGAIQFGIQQLRLRLLSRKVMNNLVIDYIRSEGTLKRGILKGPSLDEVDEEGQPIFDFADKKALLKQDRIEWSSTLDYLSELASSELTDYQLQFFKVAKTVPEAGFCPAVQAQVIFDEDTSGNRKKVVPRTFDVRAKLRKIIHLMADDLVS